MSVQTEQETLGMLRTLIDLLEKKAEATGVKLRELRDRELSHQEMQEWLRFLKGITNNGEIAPRSALLKKKTVIDVNTSLIKLNYIKKMICLKY